jgi:aspartyl/glutamyl-tRNA(Asn/Gln) amidotransferase C subunit
MIERETLDSILSLCKLSLTESQREELHAQVEKILDYFRQIDGYDAGESPERPADAPTELRDDEPRPGLSSQALQSFAIHFLDGYFSVPRIIRGGPKGA